MMQTNSKYRNKKVTVNGRRFDSKKESKRHYELFMLERAGEISALEAQKKFRLLDSQRDENGKCIEKKIDYLADFYYIDKTGKPVVEDTKSPATKKLPSYIIKRKLMLFFHGIRIVEV